MLIQMIANNYEDNNDDKPFIGWMDIYISY